ncbi:MAG: 16S rRNA (guanine(527)-N(7))-methyltransferase RsmG, partial [Pseudomonadota bacterium]
MTATPFNPAWGARLEAGLRGLGLQPSPEVSEQLLRFLSLLLKWNQAYNLTAVRDPLEMVERHLIDSLSLLPYLQGTHILDMGTGPGLPGIPLALMLPHSQFTLLDSNSKKIRFVRQAVMELKLRNVEPVHGRLEELEVERPFDVLIARAFTSLSRMWELSAKLRDHNSMLLA